MVFFTPTNTEFKVNDATINTATVTSPDVGVSSDGTSIVVWKEPFSPTDQDLRFRRFAPDGTPIDATDRTISSSGVDETNPAIAVADDGSFGVAYVRNDDIYFKRFDTDGDQLGIEILISTEQQNKVQSDPDIAIDSNGNFFIVWTHEYSATDLDIRGSVLDSNGIVAESDFSVEINGNNQSEASIDNNFNRFIVSYTGNDNGNNDIFFSVFDVNGDIVNDSNDTPLKNINAVSSTNQSDDQRESSIAIDDNGNFVISWTHESSSTDDDIHLRRFDTDGNPLDTSEIVVDSDFGDQDESVVALGNDGTIVVAYEDDSDESVKYRQFEADGTALGDSQNYDVNSSFEDNPAIAINEHNNMIIAADDDETHAFDPYARVFSTTTTDTSPLTLEAGTAQIAYVAYYGRPADPGGVNFWNDVFNSSGISYSPRQGDNLTGQESEVYNSVVNQFGESEEASRLLSGLNNEQSVNQVYNFAFNRDAELEGLNYWTGQLDNGSITLATFALEVALGAQNEDITVLRNKITSADLFSESITTQGITGYEGATGEIFGRDWLEPFGNFIATQPEVDSALSTL